MRCLLFLCLAGCLETRVDSIEQQDLSCPPVSTTFPIRSGETISSGLRDLMVDNGIVRIRYGAHTMDFRDTGVTQENQDRHLDHVLAARHTDDPSVAAQGCLSSGCHNGTHWHDAVYPIYGDGAKYSTAELNRDADRVHVLLSSSDAVELAYEWDTVRFDGLRAPGVCQLGKFPECGPTSKDTEGALVYKRDGETIKSIKAAKVWKTIRIERCTPGYYLSLRSNPPLIWSDQGSRTIRLGYLSTLVAWSCNGTEISRHPNSGFHASLGTSDCIADLPVQFTGHDSWPFVRVMRTLRSVPFNSLQYSPGQSGSPGTESIWDSVGPDGRPYPWQAFIGASEYASPNVSAEPTDTARALANAAASYVKWGP